jgi:hypothetical protein
MKEKAQVIMLPTDKAENCIVKHRVSGNLYYYDQYFTQVYLKLNDWSSHHLYFVTDDEMKEGDWVLFGDVVMVATSFGDRVICDEEGNSFMKHDCKKIIATTDPELLNWQCHHKCIGTQLSEGICQCYKKRIAQPSKAFIEKYCKEGGIDKVEVEYQVFPYKTGDIVSKTYRLKVNSHNEITIHPIKDRWTREEVEERCREVFELGASAFQDCLNPHTLELDHETFKRLKEEAINQNK